MYSFTFELKYIKNKQIVPCFQKKLYCIHFSLFFASFQNKEINLLTKEKESAKYENIVLVCFVVFLNMTDSLWKISKDGILSQSIFKPPNITMKHNVLATAVSHNGRFISILTQDSKVYLHDRDAIVFHDHEAYSDDSNSWLSFVHPLPYATTNDFSRQIDHLNLYQHGFIDDKTKIHTTM